MERSDNNSEAIGIKLKEAISNKKIIVVAGAGISKDSPANLPSWWDYNIILLECIGRFGAEALGRKENLLNMDSIKKDIPVTSISEFFVNRIAGQSYYPLLSILDGAQPNMHHLMLAELAGQGIIKGIVTTNFDTLLEKAFEKRGILFEKYDSPTDFYRQKENGVCPIYKIHGSAERSEFAIDTVHQKLKGLSVEKRYFMEQLFAENHVLFMGFSGEDYLFGTDYIPIRANKKKNYGVTWLAYPGSSFNNNTKKIISELKIDIVQTTLPDFYQKMEWSMPEINERISSVEKKFTEIAENKIMDLLSMPHIGKWACVGMCIELLDILGEKDNADDIVLLTKQYLDEHKEIDLLEGMQRVSLYSNLILHAELRNKPKDALTYCYSQQQILDALNSNEDVEGGGIGYRERMLNTSTSVIHVGKILFNFYDNIFEAKNNFLNAFYISYEARHWENMAVSLMDMALADLRIWKDVTGGKAPSQPHFIAVMEAARRIAEKGGCAQILFESNCELAQMYTIYGQRKLINEAIIRAEEAQKLCINIEKNRLFLDETRKIAEMCLEMPEWTKGRMILCLPYGYVNLWEPYGQRPLLYYEEGNEAKKIFESGKKEEGIRYLLDAANKYIENSQYEAAEMFYDCAAGIFLAEANEAGREGKSDVQELNIKNGKICYEQCLRLEFKMGRIDYLAGTLASLSKLNYLINDPDFWELAVFQAELALCLCADPTECWQSTIAMETICRVNYRINRKIKAKQYCEKYLKMVEIAPWAVSPENVEEIKNILEQC